METPKIINVGKSYLVYQGEEYMVKNELVKKHAPDHGLPARKKPADLNQVVAVYSEILHDDLSVSHHHQMMDKAEVKQRLAAAKAKKKPMTEKALLQAAKAEAILKTEFHALDASMPANNPLFKTRSLHLTKLFVLLTPLAVYGQVFVIWHLALRQDVSSWPVSIENNSLFLWLILAISCLALLHALYWLVSITLEINDSREIKLNLSTPSILVILALPFLCNFIWAIKAGRFAQNINRLIGKTPVGFIAGFTFALLPPLAHISIWYFQKRLNILDKNKMLFLIG